MAIGGNTPAPGATGVPIGTGQKYDERSRTGRSPAACVSLIVIVLPRTVIPRMCGAFPEA